MASTDFEIQLGVNRVEVRPGFAQVHVGPVGTNVTGDRMHVLKVLAEGGVSHKYLKLTQSGLSFVVTDGVEDLAKEILSKLGFPFQMLGGRSLVMVHAVSLREEEGLIATLLQCVLSATNEVDHIGDMHDTVFVVVPAEVAEEVAAKIRAAFVVAA